MVKKIVLLALSLCLVQCNYTDNKRLFEILGIHEPIKKHEVQKIKEFATFLALQDELLASVNKLYNLGLVNKEKISGLIDFISESEFMFPLRSHVSGGHYEYIWAIDYDKVKTGFAAAVFMKLKNFLEKSKNFTEQDTLLAEKLSQNANPEIQAVGKFKKKSIDQIEARQKYKNEVKDFAEFFREFRKKYLLYRDKLSETQKPLFAATDLFVFPGKIENIADEMELFEKIIATSNEIFEHYQLNQLYTDTRSFLRSQPKASTLLRYETFSGQSTLLPPSLHIPSEEAAPVSESASSVEKKQPIKKKKRTPKKRKPVKKPSKVKQEISQVAQEKEPAIEPALPIVDSSEKMHNDLVNWYNTNYPVDDHSFVSDINDFQITISDPKNNATIILFRKSQDDEKIISDPLNYDDRVELWFENPQEVLEVGGYTQKYDSIKKLKEFETRHNFAKITDAFLDKEGIDIQHIDKYGRTISGKLLAGELHLKQPDGSVEKISGVFAYGKIPGENKYYHRYFSDKEYKDIVKEYFSKSKWEVEFPPLAL